MKSVKDLTAGEKTYVFAFYTVYLMVAEFNKSTCDLVVIWTGTL